MQREMGQALLLAIPGLLLASFLTAVVARYIFDYGWSWDVSILFGSILSATDPVAVVALLRELGSSKRLATLIEVRLVSLCQSKPLYSAASRPSRY